MKKYILIILCLATLFDANAQKNKDAAAAAAGVVGGAIALKILIEQMKELVEQSATEWILDNWEYKDGDIIEVKLFEWEMKSIGDLSGARSIVFKVKQNEEPEKILLFILSPNWWNEYGIVFTKVKPLIINKEKWGNIMFKLCQIALVEDSKLIFESKEKINGVFTIKIQGAASNNNTPFTMEVSHTIDIYDLNEIKARSLVFTTMRGGTEVEAEIEFKKINGDQHIVGRIEGEDYLLDFNERRLNLYNYETKDLIKLSKGVVRDITNVLFK